MAKSPEEVDESPLVFDMIHQSIKDGGFGMHAVPRMLLDQFYKSTAYTPTQPDTSVDKDNDGRRRDSGRGRPVKNQNLQPKWKIPKADMGWFVVNCRNHGPRWTNGKGICLHYHGEGVCHDNCPFRSSHGRMPASLSPDYTSWFTTAKRELQVIRKNEQNEDSPNKDSPNKRKRPDNTSDGEKSS